jgi:hypothetical protein
MTVMRRDEALLTVLRAVRDGQLGREALTEVIALVEHGQLVRPSTDTTGAVEAERHRNASLVRALAGNSWDPATEAALYEAARQITASGGQ